MSGLVKEKVEYHTGLQERILARVVEYPGEAPRDIADYLEADYNSVTRSLSRLVQYGKIENLGGRYQPFFSDALTRAAFNLEAAGRNREIPGSTRWERFRKRLRELAGIPVMGLPAFVWLLSPAAFFLSYSYGLNPWLTSN